MNRYTTIPLTKGEIVNNFIFLAEEGFIISTKSGKRVRLGRFKCSCGKEFITRITGVRTGSIISCGCINKRGLKHGLRAHPLYNTWYYMVERCTIKDSYAYKDYGERGISVCNEWKLDFLSFYNWANENGYKKGLQIDRIDNDGNYCPENCKFSTSKEQARNRRNTILVNFNGKQICLTEYCEINNLSYVPIIKRIHGLNWSVEKAINTKIGPYKKVKING